MGNLPTRMICLKGIIQYIPEDKNSRADRLVRGKGWGQGSIAQLATFTTPDCNLIPTPVEIRKVDISQVPAVE